MRSGKSSLLGFLCVLVACVFVGAAEANTLFSIDRHLTAVVRAYAIEGNALTNPVTIIDEMFGFGLDLGISSCYNKIIILSGKDVGR